MRWRMVERQSDRGGQRRERDQRSDHYQSECFLVGNLERLREAEREKDGE